MAAGLPPRLAALAERRAGQAQALLDGPLQEVAQQPELRDSWQHVWLCSDYVAQWCLRYPAEWSRLFASADIQSAHLHQHYAEHLSQHLSAISSFDALKAALRQFRQYHMVRIVWRDLAGWADFSSTCHALSALADACVEETLHWCHAWEEKTHGNTLLPLMAVALGKLGGNELNFSSDIDLILVSPYEDDQHMTAYLRIARQWADALHTVTHEGFVFRVDLRLRPFGKSGPLVMNLHSLADYYQQHGRPWERYALMKARVINGDKEAVKKLEQLIEDFVYRPYIDFEMRDAIRKMKQKIILEVKRKQLHNNIKLGRGGIREIEFLVQSFQLVYAGKNLACRHNALLPSLTLIASEQLLSTRVAAGLTDSYILLRQVENKLQMVADQQIQVLPTAALAQDRLAYALGYASWEALKLVLDEAMALVDDAFTRLVAEEKGIGLAERTAIQAKATVNLQRLAERFCESVQEMGNQTLIAQLVALLCQEAAAFEQAETVFHNASQLLFNIINRRAYLQMLLENPHAMGALLRIIDQSPWVFAYLRRYPFLLETLLDKKGITVPLAYKPLQKAIQQSLDALDSDDLELQMNQLRYEKLSQLIRIANADLCDQLPIMQVSDHLSWLAEIVVKAVATQAWHYLLSRYGVPAGVDAYSENGFCVIAYGKLGGIELSYSSDLDLVFLYQQVEGETDGEQRLSNPQFYARFGQRIIHLLHTRTMAGTLYEADMRLRPSGQSGLLVSSVDAFAHYQVHQAWTWEHQALVRARVVCGTAAMQQAFEQIRQQVLTQQRDLETLRQQVAQMREKLRAAKWNHDYELDLRQAPGTMVDIEFLVQYWVLAYSHQYPSLCQYTDCIRIVESSADVGIINTETADQLCEAYRYFRNLLHQSTLRGGHLPLDMAIAMPLKEAVLQCWHHFFR